MDNIETFKRLCEVHCGNNEDMIKAHELRRKMKNRVSQFFQVQFGGYVQEAGNFWLASKANFL